MSIEDKIIKSFDFEWEMAKKHKLKCQYDFNYRKKLISLFIKETGMNKKWFKNRLCLDVGSGIGRWTYAMSKLDATVISLDLSKTAIKLLKESSNKGYYINANALRMPFKESTFDFIFSSGVLHHTYNTKNAFKKLIPSLKKNGVIYIKVYEWKNPFKLFISAALRKILSLISKGKVWKFSVILSHCSKNKLVRYMLNSLIEANMSGISNYDFYSTPINHFHTEQEVVGWFKESELKDIKLIKLKQHKNIFQKFFRGKNNGFIRIKGVK